LTRIIKTKMQIQEKKFFFKLLDINFEFNPFKIEIFIRALI